MVLKISRFSLNQTRLPDGDDKRSLLRVIDRARSALPLRSVLRVIRLPLGVCTHVDLPDHQSAARSRRLSSGFSMIAPVSTESLA